MNQWIAAWRLTLSILLVSIWSLPSHGFEFTGARWSIGEGASVDYVVSNDLSSDLSDGSCLRGVQEGYDVWTRLTCSYMSWSYKGRTANTGWGVGDGENVASWRESNWGDSSVALAITSAIWGGASNSLSDADIKFNGVHHGWSTDDGGASGGTDVASVSAHEVGHALGLDHSDVPGTTMWPSTGPGDTSGRTLHQDDMEGACALYPTGSAIPEAVQDPEMPEGTAGLGEDCTTAACVLPLFCINSDGEVYCTEPCSPAENDCPPDFHCAYLSDGSGACVRGEAPMNNRADFGEECGNETLCAASLVCIRDSDDFYCSGPCQMDDCPEGFFCASLANGASICARGERMEMEERPSFGEPCTDRGLCDAGFFCLTDALYTDVATGSPIPYCSESCPDGVCADGYRCIDVPPRGTACQRVPSAGDGVIGDPCWVDPEQPWLEPVCGNELICVDFRVVDGVVEERGICTMNCDEARCCPAGWACAAVTPIFAQCRPGNEDSVGFECASEGTGANADTADESASSGGGGGCRTSQFKPTGISLLMLTVLLLATYRRRLKFD